MNMIKIPNEEINLFLKLYEKHGSMRKVSKYSNRSINTVKKYLEGKVKLRSQNIVKKANLTNEILIGTYVGLWMGDGTQYYDNSYTVKFCSNKQQKELNYFIQDVILKIFDKKSCLIEEKNTNRAYIKLRSKFIYYFIYDYTKNYHEKTLNIELKYMLDNYSNEFLMGVLLGLSLSDGHLKKNFKFNVISVGLSDNANEILKRFDFSPKRYVHKRMKYGWNDLYMITLNRGESKELLKLLDFTLKSINPKLNFLNLKNGPAEI